MTARTCLGVLTLCVASLLVPAIGEAQLPPDNVFCDIIGSSNNVVVTWTNNGPYFQIRILQDGIPVVTLPGATTTHTFFGVPAGLHSFCVQALNAAGALIFPVNCCDIVVPGSGPVTGLNCTPIAGAPGVFLSWVNGAPYSTIEILVDGLLVATLPGGDTSYTVVPLAPGGHTICVRPYIGASPVLPVACCDVVIAGPVGPVTGVTCTPLVTAAGVFLTWVNGGAYSSIEVTLDGVLVSVLPGGDTSVSLVPVAPGPHTVCVTPFVLGTAILPSGCCNFTIGGPGGGPIDPLTCIPLPSLPNGIYLSWTNNGAYSSIEVRLDGVLAAVLPGSDTSYSFVGLPSGIHTVCLRAFIGGAALAPDACCTFTIGSAIQPIDPLTCTYDPAVPNAIFLMWTNNGVYSSIDVILDGAIVATLAGNTTNYMLGGLSSGPHSVCLRAYVAGSTLAPDACCSFTTPGVGSIDPLTCELVPAAAPAVLLQWTNNGPYTAIQVLLDGALVAVLPGNATSYLLTGAGPGPHTICVRPLLGGVALAETCCQITIGTPDPIPSLTCSPYPFAVGVALSWVNLGVYTSIEVELDGTLVAVLAGADTSTLIPGALTPGSHTICVTAYVGATALLPSACCSFSVAPRFVRGDANADALYNIADTVYLLTFLFTNGPAPVCSDAGDANDDGALNIADGVYILTHLFANGPQPPAPHPSCGADPTDAGDPLGCASFPPCP